MSKLKQKLPGILIALEAIKGIIQPIANAIATSGGLGFRKRVKEFTEETRKSITQLSDTVKTNAETTAEDIDDLKTDIKAIKEKLGI